MQEQLVVFASELKGDESGDRFIIGYLAEEPSEWKSEEEKNLIEVRLKKVVWSDFRGWKTRLKQDRVPFALSIPWVCKKNRLWKVGNMEEAQAVIMGSKL